MKRTVIILIGLLMVCTNLYAAGDLIVDGNLGVGTTAPAVKLDVIGKTNITSDYRHLRLLDTRSVSPGSYFTVENYSDANGDNPRLVHRYYDADTDTISGTLFTIDPDGFTNINGGLLINNIAGMTNALYAYSSVQDSPNGRGAFIQNVARISNSGYYYNKGLQVNLTQNIDNGITNSGYAAALEVSPLNTSPDVGTLATQYGVRVYYGNYDTCSGSCGVGTITNSFGVAIHPRLDNGTVNNSYALYIGQETTGATVDYKWGIYQVSNTMNNFFAGNVGLGMADWSYRLAVNGPMYATAYGPSDQNLKDDIKTIDSPLQKVMDMEGVSFNWKKTEEYKDRHFPEGRHYGVIAQQVEKILPDIVMNGKNGEKSVNYSELIPVLIEAVKEQQKEIETLKAEIERLKPQKVAATR